MTNLFPDRETCKKLADAGFPQCGYYAWGSASVPQPYNWQHRTPGLITAPTLQELVEHTLKDRDLNLLVDCAFYLAHARQRGLPLPNLAQKAAERWLQKHGPANYDCSPQPLTSPLSTKT